MSKPKNPEEYQERESMLDTMISEFESYSPEACKTMREGLTVLQDKLTKDGYTGHWQ